MHIYCVFKVVWNFPPKSADLATMVWVPCDMKSRNEATNNLEKHRLLHGKLFKECRKGFYCITLSQNYLRTIFSN